MRLTGATSEEDRYLALAAKVVECAVLDSIKKPNKNASSDQKDRVEQKASAAIGWMKTDRYNDYCNMIGISPAKIRRGVNEFNAKKRN